MVSESAFQTPRREGLIKFLTHSTIGIVMVANFVTYTALSLLSTFFPLYAERELNASSMVRVLPSPRPVAT
jgi:hypothetical protein